MTSLADFALRSHFPRPVKQVIKTGVEAVGESTSRFRALPEFLILGGQRCGTTSLYQYLVEHPSIGAASTKEVHYFDLSYHRGMDWYRGHFPTEASQRTRARRANGEATTGEASPYYLLHPLAPLRAADVLPDAKLIVMLRDPVKRLISHYHHEVALGYESLSLPDALAAESSRLAGEEERIVEDPLYVSDAHQHHSYFARGCYAPQLERWFAGFPRESFLILEQRRFFADPTASLDRVLDHIGVSPQHRTHFEAYNNLKYPPVDERLRAELAEAFEPHNQRVYELMGEDYGWG